MGTAEDYAGWIVKNADKKGTPEFDTVAQAYQIAKSGAVQPSPTEQPKSLGRTVLDTAASLTPDPRRAVMGTAEFAKPSIAPTVGNIAGRAIGTAFPILGPGITPAVVGGIGSGLGEAVNQGLGVTEPSMTNIALATGLPMALEGGANAIRTASNFIPTSKASELLNRLAPGEAAAKVAGYRSGQDVSKLFTQATQQGITIPLQATGKTILHLEEELKHATPAARAAWQSVMAKTGLADTLYAQRGEITPAQMQHLLADVGKLQAQASREGGLKAGQLGKLFSSLADDLEQSGSQLANARSVFKRETVLNEIDDQIAKAFRINRGQGEAGQFNANRVINTLQNSKESLGKFFSQSFNKTEQKDILDFFKFLNEIPTLSAPTGVNPGSMKVLRDIAVGGGLGTAVGGPGAGSAIGAAVGAIAQPAIESGEMLLQAWKMPGGKQLIKQLLTNSDGTLTPQILSTIGSFLSGKVSGMGTNTMLGPSVRPTQTSVSPLEP